MQKILYDYSILLLFVSGGAREVFCKEGVFKFFTKFPGKHLHRTLFYIKVASTCNFIKRETPTLVFSCEFCETFQHTFFIEHLEPTASVV